MIDVLTLLAMQRQKKWENYEGDTLSDFLAYEDEWFMSHLDLCSMPLAYMC